MRILLLNDYSTPTGGAEIYSLNLRNALREAGHEAMLFASSVGPPDLRRADYECWGSSQKIVNRILQTYNPIAALRLQNVLKVFNPEIVHLNIFLTQLSPSILRLLKDRAVVYTAHWYRAICPKGTKLLPDQSPCMERAGKVCLQKCLPFYLWWMDMLQLRLLNHSFHHIDFVIANSRITERRLRADGISCGATIPYFVRKPVEQSKGASFAPTVCFVGRLVPVKGVEVLIRAMQDVRKKIPEARLLIAGDGPERVKLQQYVSELNLNECIEFLGYVPNENLATLWRVSDVLAVPSLWEEPFGIVAAEALAAAIPVVATRGGGLEEIVEDGKNGFLVNRGNAEELAAKICMLLQNRPTAEKMGKDGQEKMQREFNLASHVHELLAIYERLVNEKKSIEFQN